MNNSSASNKRIAKNTLFLFFRTILIMAITLYTSRVILNVLGVEDYGTYNVIGGFVAMFSVISHALSSAISRFITFELGKGNQEKLSIIFSTSVNIQIGIAFFLLLVGEVFGVWFLNYKMNIPSERMAAANWVLQFSLLTFCVNLVSVPYNACIIAHERMKAFAYVSILEALLKLLICYALIFSSWDKLIFYAFLHFCVALIIRMTYSLYCHRNFSESRYHMIFDRPILKEMFGFAGWNFFTNGAYIFNTQGVNILINLFFGVTVNAARGIATQVEHAVLQLVNSFTTALNPQITKSYASGNRDEMLSLVFMGAKFSYLLLFIIALPLIIEADYILTLWLRLVPEHSVNFVRLAIIAALVNIIGKTGYTASMATGNIRRYVIWITSVGCLVFPVTWIVFAFGAPSESTYIVFIVIYILVEAVRLWVMKGLLDFPVRKFVREVVMNVLIVTLMAIIFPILFVRYVEPSLIRLVLSVMICLISSSVSIYLFGLTVNEKQMILNVVKKRLRL